MGGGGKGGCHRLCVPWREEIATPQGKACLFLQFYSGQLGIQRRKAWLYHKGMYNPVSAG